MKIKKLITLIMVLFLTVPAFSAAEDGGFIFAGGRIYGVTGSFALAEELVIPSEIDGRQVIEIVLLKSDSLKKVVLPPTVNTIHRAAFGGCPNLEEINLENVTAIYQGAFNGCSRLKTISSVGNLLPKSCLMGDFSFAGTGLRSLILDRDLELFSYFGDAGAASAFAGCRMLKKLNITDGVTAIGSQAFKDCESLDYLCFPAGIGRVSEGAFSGCTNLRTAVFPAANVDIYDLPTGEISGVGGVFGGCPNLTIIGRAGTTVEEYARAHNIPFIGAVITPNDRSTLVGYAMQTATVTVGGQPVPAYTVNGSVYVGESALKNLGFTCKWNREDRSTAVSAPAGISWSVELDTNPRPYSIGVFSSDTVFYYNGFRIPALNVGNGESIIDVNALAGEVLY